MNGLDERFTFGTSISMGVLTSIYRVPVSIKEELIKNPELIESLFYPDYREQGDVTPEEVGLPLDWQPSKYGFDKEWEDYLELYSQVGRYELMSALESKVTQVEHDCGGYVRYWSPEQLQQIVKMMSEFTKKDFLRECLAVDDLTDYDGKPYEDFMLESMVGIHSSFQKFIRSATETGDMMFAVSQ